MRTHHRARALAIQIQIADVILAPRQSPALRAIPNKSRPSVRTQCCSRPSVLPRNPSTLITASTGPKISSCAITASGAISAITVGSIKNPPSAFSTALPPATSRPSFLPDLDVSQNRIHRGLVHHRPHVGIRRRIADRQLRHLLAHAFHENVIHRRFDNRARTSRALLPAESERCRYGAIDCRIQIRIRANQNRIFAAHLQNRALDPDLSLLMSSPRARESPAPHRAIR